MVMRIRELRQAAGLDQTSLGQAVGATQGMVSDWENERYLPRTRQLPLLASVLQTSIDELFTEEAKAVLPCENHTMGREE